MSSSNKAAWSISKGSPIKVEDAPMPKAKPGHIIVKNVAIAINPADWKMHDSGWAVNEWPTILGCDVAGEVVEVGEGVKGFKKGQRVAGNCCRLITGNLEEAGFQLYTSVVASMVAPIPDDLSYEDAVVVPLSISTAAAGLYEPSQLALSLPTTGSKSSGGTILVWGGSSSVGCSTIQLAKLSGLRVIATASKHNFDLVESLGADVVFDHCSATAVEDIVKEMKDTKVIGCFDCIGVSETTKACADILSQLGEGHFIASVGVPDNLPSSVKGEMVFAEKIKDNFIGKAIYEDYLPKALAEKTFLPKPKPEIVGNGLEAIEAAVNKSRTGVSGVKLVVKI